MRLHNMIVTIIAELNDIKMSRVLPTTGQNIKGCWSQNNFILWVILIINSWIVTAVFE